MNWHLHVLTLTAAVLVVLAVVVTALAVVSRSWWVGRAHLAPAYGCIGLAVTGDGLFYVW